MTRQRSPAGTNRLILLFDADNAVHEFIEDNNQFQVTYTLGEAPKPLKHR